MVNRDNDYRIDREAQAVGKTYSGVKGISMQDAAIQESQGRVQNRTREFLVATDRAIVLARRRLRRVALDLQKGVAPDGLDARDQQVRSASLVLPETVNFYQAAAEALRMTEGAEHVSV